LRRDHATAVTFRVLDAGDPIRGATVSALGHSARTAANGRVTMTLRPRRRFMARVTLVGYTPGTIAVRLVR
jgi:hypothetical protein